MLISHTNTRTMNLNNYTIKSQEAIQQAVQLTTVNGQQAVEPAHILKAILEVDENVTPFILKKLNVNPASFSKMVESVIKSYPKVSGGQPHLSSSANTALAKANTYLKEYNDDYISIEHLLLGLLQAGDSTSNLMKDAGLKEKEMKAAITELRKGERVTSQSQEETYNSLNKFAINLNQQARNGKLEHGVFLRHGQSPDLVCHCALAG